MPYYVWTVEFEADDDAEAKDLIDNDRYGAKQPFGLINKDELVNQSTGERLW